MKNPTYATFMGHVENIISDLPAAKLRAIILSLAESQARTDRTRFLAQIAGHEKDVINDASTGEVLQVSLNELIEQIKAFQNRIEAGEYYDEEQSYEAYEREEYSLWHSNGYSSYDDDDINFDDEEYVAEAVEFLESAKSIYTTNDYQGALTAYRLLFDIFENDEYYDGEEYFIYGFSFQSAIDDDFYQEHKSLYLRCQYLHCSETNDYATFIGMLKSEHGLFISDIIEIDRQTIPRQDEFLDLFIADLSKNNAFEPHLVDALFVRGGIDLIKNYAYENGKSHPSVFMYYFQHLKQLNVSSTERLQAIVAGIDMIPVKYGIRSYLGLELVEIARAKDDADLELKGLAAAFYSDPGMGNFARYYNFIEKNEIAKEKEALKRYLDSIDIIESVKQYSYFHLDPDNVDVFDQNQSIISTQTLVIGKFISGSFEQLSAYIDPDSFLGFQNDLLHVASIVALTLKALSIKTQAKIVDLLINTYSLHKGIPEYDSLKMLIEEHSKTFSISPEIRNDLLDKITQLTINRISYILSHKYRNAYDNACLLLVACAEVKQIVDGEGNFLIEKINMEYKRFRAFRSSLKSLTALSTLLHSVK